MQDAFDRWGLKETATEAEIKIAYKKRVQRMHPDRMGNSPQVLAAFMQLQEDYMVLKDPLKREEILRLRRMASPHRPTPVLRPVFDELVPHSDLQVNAFIPLGTIWSGGVHEMSIEVGRPCGCQRDRTCPRCKGTGQVFVSRLVRIKVPAGTLPDQVLVVPGQGHQGSFEKGNLIVTAKWINTHHWQWKEEALHTTLVVPWWVYRPHKCVKMIAPSGTKGLFPLPGTLPSRALSVNVPNVGFPTSSGRATVVVHLRRAPWFAPWRGWLSQLRWPW